MEAGRGCQENRPHDTPIIILSQNMVLAGFWPKLVESYTNIFTIAGVNSDAQIRWPGTPEVCYS